MRIARCLPAIATAVALTSCTSGGPTAPPAGTALDPDLRNTFSHGTCQGTGPRRYGALPMNLRDIGEFIPLGVMVEAHVTPIDHQYLTPADTGRSRYDVFAPFTGSIVLIQPRVRLATDPGTAPVGVVDYRIVFEGSCTFWVYYDLVTQLEPSLLAAGGSALAANRTANVRIPVTAGQRVGKMGGQTLDLGTVNADVTLPGLLVPAHYVAEPWKVHSVDGLDAFDEPMRSQLLALDRRGALPRGGKIDFDIDGKASGNWFLVGTNWYQGNSGGAGSSAGHLSLVYGNIDPSVVVVSMGFVGGTSRQWAVRGNGPDPSGIDASSGVVKYEVMDFNPDSLRLNSNGPVRGVLLVQVLPARQLRVEYFPDVTAGAVPGFDAAAKTYER